MKNINTYILEKLKINKDSKVENERINDLIDCISKNYEDCINTLKYTLDYYNFNDINIYISTRPFNFKHYMVHYFVSVDNPYIQEKWAQLAGTKNTTSLKKCLVYKSKGMINDCSIYHIDDYIFIFTEEYDLLLEKDEN